MLAGSMLTVRADASTRQPSDKVDRLREPAGIPAVATERLRGHGTVWAVDGQLLRDHQAERREGLCHGQESARG